MDSSYYMTTGQVAELLGTSEPRLNDLIRRQKIEPIPRVMSGRRFWSIASVATAAGLLGVSLAIVNQRFDAIAKSAKAERYRDGR